MKRILLALALSAGSIAPVFAADFATMACKDFAAQDHTQQMATIAALQSSASQMQIGQTLMANDIFNQLTTKCTGHPDMMISDAVKGMH